MTDMTDKEIAEAMEEFENMKADKLIDILNLELDRKGFYYTKWGKKTLVGLRETIKNIIK